MFNKILWTIDNECDGKTFERLCTDLMYREGYKDIIPIGGNYDNGRDAEIRRLLGKNEYSEITFFQFSLEKDWLNKFNREIEKTFSKHNNITHYVFISSSKITGNKRDELREKYYKDYKTNLIFYDREWLRTRLETASLDLVKKYFKLTFEDFDVFNHDVNIVIPKEQRESIAWQNYNKRNYEFAIVEFKDMLLTYPNDPNILVALSWSLYLTFRYDEAIFYINKAIEVVGKVYNTLAIKACIIAEYGIKKNSKEYLLTAKEIFIKLSSELKRSIDYFNLANTLSALGEFNEAQKNYKLSIKKNPKSAETWKNLGSVYDHLGNHIEELNCYNKALLINPDLPQALLSKGILLLKHHNKPKDSLKLIEKAIELDEKVYYKWPMVYYWYAEAFKRLNKVKEALHKINEGISSYPDNVYMMNLKANLLATVWPEDNNYINEAITFYKHLLVLFINDKESTIELLKLYDHQKNEINYWGLIKQYFQFEVLETREYFNNISIKKELEQIIYTYDKYLDYRKTMSLDKHIEAIKEHSFLVTEELNELLNFCFSILFNTVFLFLSQKYIQQKKIKNYLRLFQELKLKMMLIIEALVIYSSKKFKLDTDEDKIECFSFNIAHWPLYLPLEMSNQLGFLFGRLNIKEKEFKEFRVILENQLVKMNKELMVHALDVANQKIKLFKK